MWDSGDAFVPGAVGGQTDWSASGRAGTAGGDDYGIEQTLAGEINLREHCWRAQQISPTDRPLIGLQRTIPRRGRHHRDWCGAELLGCAVEG